jgi:hypothetical protein
MLLCFSFEASKQKVVFDAWDHVRPHRLPISVGITALAQI